jgi:hypothetical protein
MDCFGDNSLNIKLLMVNILEFGNDNKPICFRHSPKFSFKSFPQISTWPEELRTMPEITEKVVVLPAPF